MQGTASEPEVVDPRGSALQMTCLHLAQGYLHHASSHGVNIPGCLPVSLWRAVSLMFKHPRQSGKNMLPLSETKSIIVASVFLVSHWRKMCSHLACAFMALLSGRWLNLWIFLSNLNSLFQHMTKPWKAVINHTMYKISSICRFAKCLPTFPKGLTEKSKFLDKTALLLASKTTCLHQTELIHKEPIMN